MGVKEESNILKDIIEEANKRGHSEVRIRDVAYALMKVRFKDSLIPYTICFGAPEKDSDVDAYDAKDSTKFLIRYFEKDLSPKEKLVTDLESIVKSRHKNDDGATISFEENRAGMEQLLKEIAEAKADKDTIPAKELVALLKAEADIRSKLNDKFGASEKVDEQLIIVQPKFNHICDKTRKECWLQTRDFAMQHWHLIPDPNYKDE